MRIGQGFDAHAFKDEGGLILGGVTIPYHKGMAAHSDGDVVLHALCDAILGAAALGDIGKHFPDNDPQYSGIDSRILLRHVMQLIQDQGYRVGNADLTIVAQVPKLAPFIDDMRAHIAADLNVAINQINVKATTTEHMGFTGRKEGIAAFAVVILEQV